MKRVKLFFNILKNVIKDSSNIKKDLDLDIFTFILSAPYIYLTYTINILKTIYK
jgi:hypothetical protein